MYRYLFGSEEAQGSPPATFSATFPGANISLFRPKMFCFLNSSYIAAPHAKRELTNQIAVKVPFAAPSPITFMRSTFTRVSIVTIVILPG